jgi:hypothetical protein
MTPPNRSEPSSDHATGASSSYQEQGWDEWEGEETHRLPPSFGVVC